MCSRSPKSLATTSLFLDLCTLNLECLGNWRILPSLSMPSWRLRSPWRHEILKWLTLVTSAVENMVKSITDSRGETVSPMSDSNRHQFSSKLVKKKKETKEKDVWFLSKVLFKFVYSVVCYKCYYSRFNNMFFNHVLVYYKNFSFLNIPLSMVFRFRSNKQREETRMNHIPPEDLKVSKGHKTP